MNENSSNESMQTQSSVPSADVTAEEVRKGHIKHEACVKSIGALYFIGAFLLVIAGVIGALSDDEGSFTIRIAVAVFFIGFGVVQFWIGTGLRKLKSWSRIPTGILSGIGLIGFPIGTIINAYILYLVFCTKGSTVFSPEYQQVMAATPHIKYKTSIVVWILLGLLIAVIGLAFLGPLLCFS